jgi:hypothetical protein
MWGRSALSVCLLLPLLTAGAEESINLNHVKSDLTVPAVTNDKPAAGRRFSMSLPGYANWKLVHSVYLPSDWQASGKYPVLVEYPGNGGYENRHGDKSTGRVEDCKLGYGISGGEGYIWVCLPFVDPKTKAHAPQWWGDPDATAAYCRAAVAQVCKEFGGDPEAVVLCGFSRGALACGYIGLRDDATAKLWRAMITHSHFDGVRVWGYADSDAPAARQRLQRLGDRPLYITQEQSIAEIERYLEGSKVNATIRVLPYLNHTDTWVLKNLPERAELREWLSQVLAK